MYAQARTFGVLLVLLALALASTPAGASLYTSIVPAQYIQDVINGTGNVTVGDLVFSDFTVDATAKNTGNPPDASSVKVEGVLVDGNYGLRFIGSWSVFGSQIVDTVLSFKVTSLGAPLTDDHLWMRLAGGSGTGAGASIVETLFTAPETEPLNTSLFTYTSDAGTRLTAQGTFDPIQYLWVAKDIAVNGGTGGGAAQISEFFQTFSVPEPCTLLVLAVGGALASRRGRH
jgi:hypothetical protein